MNHRAIIDLWPAPSVATFAIDLNVNERTARSWRYRNSIPAWHWTNLLAAARKRNIYVTDVDLRAAVDRRAA